MRGDKLMHLIALHDKALDEQLAWAKAYNPKLTSIQLCAYSSGFDSGWNACLKALRENKALVRDL